MPQVTARRREVTHDMDAAMVPADADAMEILESVMACLARTDPADHVASLPRGVGSVVRHPSR